MQKKALITLGFNILVSLAFIIVIASAVSKGYEESFTAYAIIYSLVVIFVNTFISTRNK